MSKVISEAEARAASVDMTAEPTIRHRKKVDEIRASIHTADQAEPCHCIHYADLDLATPNGKVITPDIAIFCQEPDDIDVAVTIKPEAVILVLRKGWNLSDWNPLAVPFWLHIQVKDVVVFDGECGAILHWVDDTSYQVYQSPKTLTLQCGCVCTV